MAHFFNKLVCSCLLQIVKANFRRCDKFFKSKVTEHLIVDFYRRRYVLALSKPCISPEFFIGDTANDPTGIFAPQRNVRSHQSPLKNVFSVRDMRLRRISGPSTSDRFTLLIDKAPPVLIFNVWPSVGGCSTYPGNFMGGRTIRCDLTFKRPKLTTIERDRGICTSLRTLARVAPRLWAHLPANALEAGRAHLIGDMRLKDPDLQRYTLAVMKFWWVAGASFVPRL